MSRITSILILLCLTSLADACGRCGYYRSCKVRTVYKDRVIREPIQQTTLNFVYPAGSTQYTVGQAAAVYGMNPDLAVAALSKQADNAGAYLSAAVTAGFQGNEAVAELAKIQAGTTLVQSLLSDNSTKVTTLQITNGEVKVINSNTSAEQLTQQARQGESILNQKCATCHGSLKADGSPNASPEGGYYIEAGAAVSKDLLADAFLALESGSMPQGDTLSPDEKGAVMKELAELYRQTP